MTVNRTTLLDLPLPVTGTESGTWGDTTNNGLTQYMDIAIAGMSNLTSANFTAGALTLANTTGDSSATNIAAGSAQYGAIKVSSLATNSTITAPSSNRRYTIINADATYSVTIKASGQTGVTIVAGEKALVAFNGTDYVKIATANGTGEFTTVDTTNLEVTNIKAKDGTAAATIADSTGVVSITANPILSGGTANGVLYLNGSKVATSGSALTFDGTNFATTGTATATKLIPTGNVTAGNGMYLPTTNELAWSVNGSEGMRLTSTGLGIGTSSPLVKFDVKGTTDTHVGITASGIDEAIILAFDDGGIRTPNLSYAAASHKFLCNTTETMRLDSSGNLGLGTTSPVVKLHVNSAAVDEVARFEGTGSPYISVYVSGTRQLYFGSVGASDVDLWVETNKNLRFATNNTERARITSGGEFYIAGTTDQGAYNLQCNGTGVWGAGAYVNGSDERLKDDIQSLDSCLNVVNALRPVTFKYKPEHSKDQSIQTGFIAQELQQVLAGKPYLEGLVQEGPQHLNVAYQNIIPLLTKAIQEQQALIESLTSRVAQLEGTQP